MAGVLATLLAVALAVVSGAAGARALGVRGRAAGALAALVLAAATILATAFALSLVDALSRWPWLAAQAVCAVGAVLLALRSGARLRRPRRADVRALVAQARNGASAHPGIAVLVVVAGLAMAAQAVIAVVVAPQNWDAMTYHLAKAAYWLQFDSATPFPHGTSRQLYTPPNAELLQAWTMEMSGADRLVQLAQWIAGLAATLGVVAGARLLGAPRAHALFAGALFITLPQPIIQAASAQNDLVTAAFVLAAAVFAVRGLRDEQRGDLVVAGVAAGCAVGTKGTALIVAPTVALLVFIVLVRFRPSRGTVVTGLVALVAGVLVLGSFGYAFNIKNTGHPVPGAAGSVTLSYAPADAGDEEGDGAGSTAAPRVKEPGRAERAARNAFHVVWTFADAPALSTPMFERLLARPLRSVVGDWGVPGWMPLSVDTRVQDDLSSFGLVGWLLLFPVWMLALVARRVRPERRVLALTLVASFAVYALLLSANPFYGRILLPWVALFAPLLAVLAERPWTRTLATILAVLSVVPSVLFDDRRAVLAPEGITSAVHWGRYEAFERTRPAQGYAQVALDRLLARDAPIGWVGGSDSWVYPFFGPHFERRVVPIPYDQATPERLRREGLAGIVYADVGRPGAGFRVSRLGEGLYLAR